MKEKLITRVGTFLLVVLAMAMFFQIIVPEKSMPDSTDHQMGCGEYGGYCQLPDGSINVPSDSPLRSFVGNSISPSSGRESLAADVVVGLLMLTLVVVLIWYIERDETINTP